MARRILQAHGTRRRLRVLIIGTVGAGVLGLGGASSAQAAGSHFTCEAQALILVGTGSPAFASADDHDCASEERTFIFGSPSPLPAVFPVQPNVLFARTVLNGKHWTQSYAAADVVRIGTADNGLLLEGLEASATMSCANGKPKLVTNGGVIDVHILMGGRETITNIGNGRDYLIFPGVGRVDFNVQERTGLNRIERTAVRITELRSGKVLAELGKAEAGFSGTPCA